MGFIVSQCNRTKHTRTDIAYDKFVKRIGNKAQQLQFSTYLVDEVEVEILKFEVY